MEAYLPPPFHNLTAVTAAVITAVPIVVAVIAVLAATDVSALHKLLPFTKAIGDLAGFVWASLLPLMTLVARVHF